MSIDENVLQFFVSQRLGWLSFLVLTITYSGGYLVVSGVTFLSALSFYIHRQTDKILPLFISVFGSAATVFIIKHIFYRARPLSAAIYLETSSSFPSGHATIAMALYGFLVYTIWKHEKHHLQNPAIWGLVILILLIGISRLYLGVHYLSDVLVGYMIGFIWILVSLAISKSKTWPLLDNKHLL